MTEHELRPAASPWTPLARATAIVAAASTLGSLAFLVFGVVAQLPS
jgi:hypothetical protein